MINILWFLIALFSTLIIVRVGAHLLHDFKNYGTRHEKSRTPTAFLRNKIGLDIHHIHFGFLILIIDLILFLIFGGKTIIFILLGIGLSLILDQITPLIDKKSCYFSKSKLLISIIFHIIVALITIIVLFRTS